MYSAGQNEVRSSLTEAYAEQILVVRQEIQDLANSKIAEANQKISQFGATIARVRTNNQALISEISTLVEDRNIIVNELQLLMADYSIATMRNEELEKQLSELGDINDRLNQDVGSCTVNDNFISVFNSTNNIANSQLRRSG